MAHIVFFYITSLILSFFATADATSYQAFAKVYNNTDPQTVLGYISFTQVDDTTITINGTLTNLINKNMSHGFHVHEFGNLGVDFNCMNVGGHYNPNNYTHGGPDDKIRHIGDLGNVWVDETGTATINIELAAELLPLLGPHSVVGRAVVIHSNTDDLGKGGQVDSNTTGHAGSRLGCGVIGVASDNLIAAGDSDGLDAPYPRKAVATVLSADGSIVYGVAEFLQLTPTSEMQINGTLTNVAPVSESHGFHVHNLGILTDCMACGLHYNPNNKDHGAPNDTNRHIGDLGNVDADGNGHATFNFMLPVASLPLVGKQSILGRVLVLHHDTDDLGKGNFSDSKTTGHAGARIGCGVIGIASGFGPAGSGASATTTEQSHPTTAGASSCNSNVLMLSSFAIFTAIAKALKVM